MPGKLLHVLGGGLWQLPTVRLARRLGCRVLVTDLYEERPAYALADAHETIDIRDRERTLEASKRHGIDGILCDTTDVGVPTMAYVADALDLPGLGLETALRFTDKEQMRLRAARIGIPQPVFAVLEAPDALDEIAADLGYPLVLKPTDSQSSRGVVVVRAPGELDAAWGIAHGAAHGGRVLAEAFLEGTEVTVEGYVVRGDVFAVGISDKGHFPHRPGVASRLTWPADLPRETVGEIERVNAQVVLGLGLETGIFHAEYMVDEGQVHLVEIAARGGGSHVYSHVVPHLAGVPVPEMYVRHVLGEEAWTPPTYRPRAAHLQFPQLPRGRVTRVRGLEEARRVPGVAVLLVECGPGDVLQPPEDDRSRPAQILTLGETREEVLAAAEKALALLEIEVEEDAS